MKEALIAPDQVYYLDLSSQELTSLPEGLFQLKNLQILDISLNSSLTTLDARIGTLRGLQKISCIGCGLQSLPPEIGSLKNLRTLTLFGCQLTALPKQIGQLSKLKKLDLLNNHIKKLPPSIGQLTKLETLYLGGNELSSLPTEIYNLPRLKDLILGDNQLVSISDSIGRLGQLTQLSLSYNQMSNLPTAIKHLSSLTSLHLAGNRFTTLPEEISALTKLSSLDIQDNKRLRRLPQSLATLEELNYVILSGCPNLDLEDTIEKLSFLTKLTQLELRRMAKPLKIPKNIVKLYPLKALNAADNTLEEGSIRGLLEKLGKMDRLTYLILRNCHLDHLPKNISKLHQLEILDISSNANITSVPVEQLNTMKQLKNVNISFTGIPSSVSEAYKKAMPQLTIYSFK